MTEQERDALLDQIAEKELKMFLDAPDESEGLKQRPEAFKLTRVMAHSAHDEAFLSSYLRDLTDAAKVGRNFIVEKYGRLQNILPPLNESPLLAKIASAEAAWLNEAHKLYPEIIKKGASDKFEDFLRCELETLSDKSLELYGEEVQNALAEKKNLALARHNWLAQKLGKAPLI